MNSDSAIKPIQIYLDSSDFSYLSSPNTRTSEHDEVESFLLRMQQEKRIELRFSQAHVAEASPVKQSDLEFATRRLSHIKKLCGGRCFMPPSALMEAEVRSAAGSPSLKRDDLYRNNGSWPPFDEGDFNFPSPGEMLRELIKERFPEHSDRQRIERTLFDKKGRLKVAAQAILDQNKAAFLNDFSRQYPISPEGAKTILRYMLGEGTREGAFAEVQASFADLDVFAQWYAKNWDATNETSAWLRSTGNALKNTLEATSDELARAYDTAIATGMLPEAFWEIGRSTFQSLLAGILFGIAERIAKKIHLHDFTESSQSSWQNMPGLYCASTIGVHVARRVAMLPGIRRKAKSSDFGDIYHSLYLPYVDIFRCDAFIGSVIFEAKLPFPTRVVDRFLDLPLAIEKSFREV